MTLNLHSYYNKTTLCTLADPPPLALPLFCNPPAGTPFPKLAYPLLKTKCTQTFITKANLDIHQTYAHIEVPQHICNKCEKEFNNNAELSTHILDKHNTNNWALLVGDSHVKTVKSRHIERKLKGNKLRNPAASSPREGSAYTTTRDWPNAHFPNSNLADRVPELLKERSYESIIVLTPSNNITNIDQLDWEDQNKLAIV